MQHLGVTRALGPTWEIERIRLKAGKAEDIFFLEINEKCDESHVEPHDGGTVQPQVVKRVARCLRVI